MAKYDTYKMKLQLGTSADQAQIELSVLLEEGDVVFDVMENTRELLRLQAVAMKEAKFLKEVAQ